MQTKMNETRYFGSTFVEVEYLSDGATLKALVNKLHIVSLCGQTLHMADGSSVSLTEDSAKKVHKALYWELVCKAHTDD